MKESNMVKMNVYCPTESADTVRLAIGKSGAGKIGKYQYCSFVTEGHGYFLPEEGASPAVGTVGEINKVPEVKIEFICEREIIKEVIANIKAVHPYEEVPIDIFPMLDVE